MHQNPDAMEVPNKVEPEPAPSPRLKIYFLPNLMTAGNLFCGFVALTKIVEAAEGDFHPIRVALGFIFLAGIFDMLDGRVARMGGVESPFGREFDSLADLISFGAAPAFLVHKIVLHPIFAAPQIHRPEIGWFIASIYLICGALRLARFNCLAAMPGVSGGKEFMGFPIPAAAGLVASVTYFLMWNETRDTDFLTGWGRFVLPALMLLLSMLRDDRRLVVFGFLFDFLAHLARDARANKAVEQIRSENDRQNYRQNILPKNHKAADKQYRHNHRRKWPSRLQIQFLE